MGLLITLNLISFIVYGTIDAPPSRGFSYVEVWIVGMVSIISLAILEYCFILGLKRVNGLLCLCNRPLLKNIDLVITMIDFVSLIISVLVFLLFVILYWARYF